MIIMAGNMATVRHGTGTVTEILHLINKHQIERQRANWECLESLEILRPTPSDTLLSM